MVKLELASLWFRINTVTSSKYIHRQKNHLRLYEYMFLTFSWPPQTEWSVSNHVSANISILKVSAIWATFKGVDPKSRGGSSF